MIRTVFFLLLSFISLPVFSQLHDQDSAWILDHYKKIERSLPMRDGVKLFTSIYLPKDASEKHPILISRTPYSCAPYGEENFRPFWSTHWKYYMREGYIIVIQDVRGRWMSEGEFMDVRPFNKNKKGDETDEASDTYDTIDWLVNNLPANNGKVGAFGISYPGFYSTMAAASGHPALKAVSPQAPVTDWFIGDDFHHNGAFMFMDAFAFYSSFGKPRPHLTTIAPTPFEFYTQDNYKFFLETGAIPNFTKLMGDSISFWKDLLAHPDYDEWWKARDARKALYNIKPAILTVGGLFDAEDCYGAWQTYKALEKQTAATNSKLVMGPWYHGQWARGDGSSLGHVQFGSATSYWYQNNIEIPFFNYHLKSKGSDTGIAEATIFFSGENKWKRLDQWPPATSTQQPLYLQPDGKLSFSKPGVTKASAEYISDPARPVPYTEDVHFKRTREYMTDDQRFAHRRPDVLSFQTGVLTDDLTLAGPLTADLKVSISSTDADFVVKLIDVFPDDFTSGENISYPVAGYQMLVRGEIMRGKYRNSFSKPEAFTPGKVATVKFELPDVAHTFGKGHRLMIQVQSSWFPLADRNPQQFLNIYNAKDSDFRKATIRIHFDSENPSAILLPVMKK